MCFKFGGGSGSGDNCAIVAVSVLSWFSGSFPEPPVVIQYFSTIPPGGQNVCFARLKTRGPLRCATNFVLISRLPISTARHGLHCPHAGRQRSASGRRKN